MEHICLVSTVKEELYELCRQHIAHGIAAAKQAIEDAREAAAGETKSSAGDKYETAREMMQQEVELNSTRLAELQGLKALLETIDAGAVRGTAGPGSLVMTNGGNYLIAAGIGKLSLRGTTFYVLSAQSPLGRQLSGLRSGDRFSFNAKEILITEIL
jgi:transcription elongation GreA/GreB family factor